MAAPTLAELNQKLTEARAAAERTGKRQEFAVEGGLRVKAYPSRKAAFAYRYKAPGSNVLRTLTLASIGRRVAAAELEAVQELHRAAKKRP